MLCSVTARASLSAFVCFYNAFEMTGFWRRLHAWLLRTKNFSRELWGLSKIRLYVLSAGLDVFDDKLIITAMGLGVEIELGSGRFTIVPILIAESATW